MPPLSDETCKDNNPGLRSSGLPAEFKNTSAMPSMQPPKAKPPCAKCRAKKLSGMKYIQPEVPASFKPQGAYKPSSFPLESGTIYRLSYSGVEGETMKECRQTSTRRVDNIQPPDMPISQDTVFRLSFTGAQGERPAPYKPVYRNMMGSGPMQCMTTHRHDFVPKVPEITYPVRTNNNNITLSTAKMDCATTMSLSYQPVEGERAVSFKPSAVYKKSDYKLEQDTIQRLSYQPWEPMPKEEFPWAKKEQYKQPAFSMEGSTIYRASYLPAEKYERTPSHKPLMSMNVSDKPLSSDTIYRQSYQDNGSVPRALPVVKKENISFSAQPMSNETTARLSYTGVVGERAIPYKPLYRNMMGSGPMQSMTTHRHDYIPKPFSSVENFRPKPSFIPSSFKMEDITTFRASYLPNEGVTRTESYKPHSVYKKSEYPLESSTINRLSYQPCPLMPKEEYPWMKRARYQQPQSAMDGTSIYRGSYLAPGNYVNDGSGGGDEECECQKQGSATDDL